MTSDKQSHSRSPVHPAATYGRADDLWIVTSYFNPAGYRTKLENYREFKERIVSSGLRLLTIECAFDGDAFTLPASSDVLRVRARAVMWQKERLLNLAIAHLPDDCAKVVWSDCDLLFENPDWAREASHLLDTFPVVQLFDTAVRLPRGARCFEGEGLVKTGFSAWLADDPSAGYLADSRVHGHTGFAWGARRELVAECGLYDAMIVGGGDHMMAHAMCGHWDSPCLISILPDCQREHFLRWGARLFEAVGGRVGHVPGTALHLWHGEFRDRQYVLRHEDLRAFSFDPQTDLRLGDTGCWEWASDKVEMHRWVASYFERRNEDGERTVDTRPSLRTADR